MNFSDHMKKAFNLSAKVKDWDSPLFSWEKAYIGSVFSFAAYQFIPKFEIEDAERAKLIPCDQYKVIHQNQSFDNLSRSLSELGEGVTFFTITRRNVVVIIAKLRNVVFIALRGTTFCYSDAVADLNFSKIRLLPDKRCLIKFHKGFFDAVSGCLPEVIERIIECIDPNTPIYVTGHSLGGGAMAAIMRAKLNEDEMWSYKYLSGRFRKLGVLKPWDIRTVSSYTFGMPRYGNSYAVSHLASPYHIYNISDFVPTMYPIMFGFADSQNEYCLTTDEKLLKTNSKGKGSLKLTADKKMLLGKAEHKIERYIENVEFAIKKNFGT
jgi:Lipase (class 3)